MKIDGTFWDCPETFLYVSFVDDEQRTTNRETAE